MIQVFVRYENGFADNTKYFESAQIEQAIEAAHKMAGWYPEECVYMMGTKGKKTLYINEQDGFSTVGKPWGKEATPENTLDL